MLVVAPIFSVQYCTKGLLNGLGEPSWRVEELLRFGSALVSVPRFDQVKSLTDTATVEPSLSVIL